MKTPKLLILGLIKSYQFVFSQDHGMLRLFGPRCRFYPSCSQYTIEAVKKYGIAIGIWMGCKRIVRCHPFNKGGYDPLY